MKEISRATLNEKDYILIYTTSINKMNTIVTDIMDIAGKLLDGAYASVRIMNASEIYQLPKELWNVGYFDGVEAQMDVYRHSGYVIKNPFKIKALRTSDYKVIDINPREEKRIQKASKLLDNGNISYSAWNMNDVLDGKFETSNYNNIISDSTHVESDDVLDNKTKPLKKDKVVKTEKSIKKNTPVKVEKTSNKDKSKSIKKDKSIKHTKLGKKKSNDDGFKLEDDMFDEIDNNEKIDDDELF